MISGFQEFLLSIPIMINNMGHIIQLISTLKTLRKILWVHNVYQPMIFNITGPHIGYHTSIGLKIGIVHLKDIQPREGVAKSRGHDKCN